MLDAEFLGVLRLVDIAKRGTWPVAGGSLDQTKAFLELCHFAWREEAEWRARLKMPNAE